MDRKLLSKQLLNLNMDITNAPQKGMSDLCTDRLGPVVSHIQRSTAHQSPVSNASMPCEHQWGHLLISFLSHTCGFSLARLVLQIQAQFSHLQLQSQPIMGFLLFICQMKKK